MTKLFKVIADWWYRWKIARIDRRINRIRMERFG